MFMTLFAILINKVVNDSEDNLKGDLGSIKKKIIISFSDKYAIIKPDDQ